MAELNRNIIAVVGPTASGKTALAVELCKIFGGEVVSCDSMQIYRGMPIATATPTEEEMQGIPHHLIGFADPKESFSVAAYCTLANECINSIFARGKLPVLAGGTGLYYSSLTENITFTEQPDNALVREKLKLKAEKDGAQSLLDELAAIDPETAAALHVNNLGRIMRALEIYEITGITMTEAKRRSRLNPPTFSTTAIGLDARDRQYLYNRINRRVDIMLQNGLLDEAEHYYRELGGNTSAQAIGYKELYPYLKGEASLEDCVEHLKLATRHYAKRQLTWFHRDEKINFLNIDDYSGLSSLTEAAVLKIKEVQSING